MSRRNVILARIIGLICFAAMFYYWAENDFTNWKTGNRTAGWILFAVGAVFFFGSFGSHKTRNK